MNHESWWGVEDSQLTFCAYPEISSVNHLTPQDWHYTCILGGFTVDISGSCVRSVRPHFLRVKHGVATSGKDIQMFLCIWSCILGGFTVGISGSCVRSVRPHFLRVKHGVATSGKDIQMFLCIWSCILGGFTVDISGSCVRSVWPHFLRVKHGIATSGKDIKMFYASSLSLLYFTSASDRTITTWNTCGILSRGTLLSWSKGGLLHNWFITHQL